LTRWRATSTKPVPPSPQPPQTHTPSPDPPHRSSMPRTVTHMSMRLHRRDIAAGPLVGVRRERAERLVPHMGPLRPGVGRPVGMAKDQVSKVWPIITTIIRLNRVVVLLGAMVTVLVSLHEEKTWL
jgi:hypothetical protein